MKKTSLLIVILYGACAVIWTVKAALETAYGTYNDDLVMYVLGMLCAAMWIGAFIAALKRHLDGRKEDAQS